MFKFRMAEMQGVVNMLPLVRKFFKDERGTAVVIIAAAFAVLMGFTALAIDSGILYLEHTRMARAADASVLAGAQELPDTAGARSNALDYAQRNGIDPSTLDISFSADNKQITVTARKLVNLYFAKLIGFNTSTVKGTATARIAPVKITRGLIPVGINEVMLPLTVGQEYMIKAGAHSNVQGWREIIEFPGENGATDYRNTSLNGYPNTVQINDQVGKAAGNMSGPTMQGLQERIDNCTDGSTWNNYQPGCPRVVLVPIYRDLAPENKVKIVGFASVFLERVTGNGQESEVYAKYINNTVFGETDDSLTNSYLNSVRLVQ